ncbi:short chain dehydrogenase [Pleionea sediminis]|uniref:short chain dehydrogenase n=1 Tax=Pleionea sediminis TaxID=2569479 RepID=UPI00118615BD|nr:short chain dehydrogenase [Pleionea sediminis]
MKIIVVGATGTLGKAVVGALKADHEVIEVGFQSGDVTVDINNLESIRAMYQQIGEFDALVSATGLVHFGPLEDISQEQWMLGINNKLMGQINLVIEGIKHIRDNGSFTLTTGVISQDPIPYGAAATTVNRAVEGFVESAALELPRGIRINAVSPTILEESVEAFGMAFQGFQPIPAAKAALGFVKSVGGKRTGETFVVKGLI